MNQPLRYVIDASVGIKLFLNEPLSAEAHTLFAHLAAEPPAQFFVPDLFYIECTNILWKHTRRSGLAAATAQTYLELLADLNLDITATADLMVGALNLATTWNISAYDACYMMLAQSLGVPLVTADEKLVRAMSGSNLAIEWLGQLALPPTTA
jgi:predicted nucleic acid-binding protein